MCNLFRSFFLKKGLCQGDPLSLYLVIIYLEALSCCHNYLDAVLVSSLSGTAHPFLTCSLPMIAPSFLKRLWMAAPLSGRLFPHSVIFKGKVLITSNLFSVPTFLCFCSYVQKFFQSKNQSY